jgi:integrase
VEVFGETPSTSVVTIAPDLLVSKFLAAYAAGELPGKAPSDATIELAIYLLLGARGFLAFAKVRGLAFTEVSAMRWLEERAKTDSGDTIRLCASHLRRLAAYAHAQGALTREATEAIRKIRTPPPARGRVHREGVPSDAEIMRLLDALRPKRRDGAPYGLVAELQLRLGLRPSEAIAIEMDWLDEAASCVHVRVSARYRPKDGETRTIDGVDAETFELARRVLTLKERYRFTRSAYKQALKRAMDRLARAGSPWRYRARGQSLRAAHATVSRARGIPLSTVSRRLGHSSERTTERSYVGLQRNQVMGPFNGVPVRTLDQEPTADMRSARRRKR